MNRTLLSLAILKTNWTQAKLDYIDNFVPFLANLFTKKEYQQFEAKDLSGLRKDFKEEYGLIIPHYALLTICNRASKEKYKILKRDTGIFFVQKDQLPSFNNSKCRKVIEEEFSTIIHKIIKYAGATFGMNSTEEEIADAIIEFLKRHDLDILFAARDKSLLPVVKSNVKLKYVVSNYAIYAKDHDADSFNMLVDLAIGNALAGTILYDESTYSGRLKDLNIYIDTPLVLSMMGLNGKFKEIAFEELLGLLREEKANLKILETTRGEVESILELSYKMLEKGQDKIDLDKAPIAVRHCVDEGMTAIDLEQKIIGLDDLLKKCGIESSKVPEYMATKEFQIDEEQLKQTIIETYKTNTSDFSLGSRKERSIDRDVKVLSGIYRFRKGTRPKTIKQSKDIFITSNTALAFASRLYEQQRGDDVTTVPSCLTDVFIGTLIWLQSPQKVDILSRKKFIADCFAATKPSETLIDAYLSAVEKMKENDKVSLDEYYLLRSHHSALNLLEEKTLGDPDAITGDTISEIIQRIKADIRGKAAEDLEKEKAEHCITKSELDKERFINVQREQELEEKAERIGAMVANIAWFIILIILAVVLYVITIPGFGIPSIIMAVFMVAYIVISVLNLGANFSFLDVKTWIKDFVTRKALEYFKS